MLTGVDNLVRSSGAWMMARLDRPVCEQQHETFRTIPDGRVDGHTSTEGIELSLSMLSPASLCGHGVPAAAVQTIP